jgi:pyruvate dehydrogenase E1 component alpha subunit
MEGNMPLTEIKKFSLPHLSILDESGNVDKQLEPDLSDERLSELYESMVYGREADQRMIKLQRQGRIGTFAPSTGQEASICGVAFAMGKEDWLVPTFREMPGMVMRGHPWINQLLYYNGYEEGNRFPSNQKTLPVSVIVGSQLLHAVGIAYAVKYREEKDVAVVAFVGDGGSSQGDFHEALNFASVWQVPVVFVVQNNGWAISIPRSKQTHSETLAQKAFAFDIPTQQVDGNDALAVYQSTKDALDRAYGGDGPSLIESVTYRLSMHTTADDPTKYRSDEELEVWKARDPLPRFKNYLIEKKILNEEKDAALIEKVRQKIDGQVKEFEALETFDPEDCFDHVFGTKHEYIEEQRREFLELVRKEA